MDVKEEIEKVNEIPPDSQILIYMSQVLSDFVVINQIPHLQSHCTLNLTIKIVDGPLSFKSASLSSSVPSLLTNLGMYKLICKRNGKLYSMEVCIIGGKYFIKKVTRLTGFLSNGSSEAESDKSGEQSLSASTSSANTNMESSWIDHLKAEEQENPVIEEIVEDEKPIVETVIPSVSNLNITETVLQATTVHDSPPSYRTAKALVRRSNSSSASSLEIKKQPKSKILVKKSHRPQLITQAPPQAPPVKLPPLPTALNSTGNPVCEKCKRKLRITKVFKCRCGHIFCDVHRYNDQHECTFDFKSHGREKLLKDNPQVKNDKYTSW
jgi:hypothetical protein